MFENQPAIINVQKFVPFLNDQTNDIKCKNHVFAGKFYQMCVFFHMCFVPDKQPDTGFLWEIIEYNGRYRQKLHTGISWEIIEYNGLNRPKILERTC